MVAVRSTMLALGETAPAFTLLDPTTGGTLSLDDLDPSKALLVMFICNHCPYVVHVMDELDRLDEDYRDRVNIVAINANDTIAYPQDGPEAMKALVAQRGWSFPFLLDETQAVAQAYQAACTPDFFLFDAERRLFYRGQLDDARPGNNAPVTGKDLRGALDALLANAAPPALQRPSMGCSIKWREGNTPSYFG